MKTSMNNTRRSAAKRALLWAAGLLLFALMLIEPDNALGQCTCPWVSNGANINNTNTGNGGVGTITPASRFHVFENPVNAAIDNAGSYFLLESRNNTGTPIANTHSRSGRQGGTHTGNAYESGPGAFKSWFLTPPYRFPLVSGILIKKVDIEKMRANARNDRLLFAISRHERSGSPTHH